MPRKPSKPGPLRASRSLWWLRAALCAIALLAYADSFGAGFAHDSTELVLKDPRIRAATSENLDLILHNDYWFLNYSSGLYRPVTTASFLLNYAILGDGESAAGYHWVNFLLHLGNVWLVFALARRLFESNGNILGCPLVDDMKDVGPVLGDQSGQICQCSRNIS